MINSQNGHGHSSHQTVQERENYARHSTLRTTRVPDFLKVRANAEPWNIHLNKVKQLKLKSQVLGEEGEAGKALRGQIWESSISSRVLLYTAGQLENFRKNKNQRWLLLEVHIPRITPKVLISYAWGLDPSNLFSMSTPGDYKAVIYPWTTFGEISL